MSTGRRERLRAALGTVGVWTRELDRVPHHRLSSTLTALEDAGLRAVWVGESTGREAFSSAALALAASRRLTVGLGVANLWARDATATVAAQATLTEAFGDRFVLGLGVSHLPQVTARGARFDRPVATVAAYLDAMDAAAGHYTGPHPQHRPVLVLAALGPRMLDLARGRADGVQTYFAPVAHTAAARAALGPEPVLIVELAVACDDDPQRARAQARRHAAACLALPSYPANLRRLGYPPRDLAGAGSDRLVDDVIAVGPPEAAAERALAHLAAGADHVCLQPLGRQPGQVPSRLLAGIADRVRHAAP